MDWGQAAQGAAGGAATGTGILPGWGTVIGGVGGGILGLLGGSDGKSEQQKRLDDAMKGLGERPQMGPAQLAMNSPYEANRQRQVALLEAQARGQGPSLAANQMREAMDRSTGAQTSLAAGAAGRGVNSGAAYMNAANQMNAMQSQGARDTANARVQEQYNAQNLLSGTLGTAIGQNNSLSQFNATQQNTVALNNLDAKLRSMGLDDQTRMSILQMYQQQSSPGMGTSLLAGGATSLANWAGAHQAKQPTTTTVAPSNAQSGTIDPGTGLMNP